ncbi:MBL fold metallo-hydrolase [uncultured Desulfobacter sp.]|uniref:MBL fold metallo-hydrolase n=1 Tax=uncultured Desulfobacter sp. TaxID=240139 RepID=UPI0029F5C0C6|nr:MBL fold metallo-hydrolase [uncultured Desulfobacter sp.]
MRQFHPGPFCWHWAYFENWGYPKENIREGDWHDKLSLGEDVVVHMLPARHYSGRLFKENKTLWAGFALETPEHKIFFSGDSGYGSHFSQIGKTFNGFDLVIMSRATLFRRIILPQAIRIGLPAYGNEVVYTIKCQHR